MDGRSRQRLTNQRLIQAWKRRGVKIKVIFFQMMIMISYSYGPYGYDILDVLIYGECNEKPTNIIGLKITVVKYVK